MTKYIETDFNILNYAKSLSDSIFKDKLVYSGISGSLVYGGAIPNESDIDWFVVIKDNNLTTYQREELTKMFEQAYYQLNSKFNFRPDSNWPGELITLSDILKSVKGKGIEVKYRDVCTGNSYLTPSDPIVSYYMWLCFISFSTFVSGDSQAYSNHKLLAWESLVKYCFVVNGFKELKANEILNNIKGKYNNNLHFGWHERYFKFDDKENETVKQAINSLLLKEYISLRENGLVSPNMPKIIEWINSIRYSHEYLRSAKI